MLQRITTKIDKESKVVKEAASKILLNIEPSLFYGAYISFISYKNAMRLAFFLYFSN